MFRLESASDLSAASNVAVQVLYVRDDGEHQHLPDTFGAERIARIRSSTSP